MENLAVDDLVKNMMYILTYTSSKEANKHKVISNGAMESLLSSEKSFFTTNNSFITWSMLLLRAKIF